MTTFKIASWNVNSIRVRLPQVIAWLASAKPDILALQETKIEDANFPQAELNALGYQVIFSGQKAYNGMAIISKINTEGMYKELPDMEDPQKRVLGCSLEELRFLNLYVPNGEHPTSKKYEYKLNWLQKLNNHLQSEIKQFSKMVIVGDFNIAPHDLDVYDPAKWEGQILCSGPERQAFNQILDLGFVDSYRHLSSETKDFTWWDYRLNAYKRNLGLRIDHILVSKELIKNCTACYVDRVPRGWERPSDHAPIIAEFKL